MSELCESARGKDKPAPPAAALRVRTLELLWHCRECDEEWEQLGLQGASLAEGITSLDYHSFSNRLVTTGGDGCLRLWQLDNAAVEVWLTHGGTDMARCSTHLAKMTTVWMPLTARWSPQGALIASGHCEGKICLWWCTEPALGGTSGNETPNGSDNTLREEWKDYRHFAGHVSDVYDLVFSPDSRYIFSGASDGSIAIHDLEGGTMPVVHLPNQHSKFCCGVAWDPWSRYLHSFGACPALQCYTNVPSRREGDRMHLASQRRCQGDFLGEPDALSFRRISWSPDGLFLAVPYGKVAQDSHTKLATHQDMGRRSLFDAIDAKLIEEQEIHGEDVIHNGVEAIFENEEAPEEVVVVEAKDGNRKRSTVNRYVSPDTGKFPSESKKKGACMNHSVKNAKEEEKDMVHCVNIYLRNTLDKLAARLVIRGYNEIRGVQWAPCFLEPLPPKEPLPLVLERPLQAGAAETDLLPLASKLLNGKPFCTSSLEPFDSGVENAAQVGGEVKKMDSTNVYGAWGPGDYCMALAVWTCDSVLVYTTGSCARHSDFTDLHARSITDVCWGKGARFLYTASLDGYVSVISFGTSLTPAHRFPTFSNRPVTISLAKMLKHMQQGLETERSRKTLGGAHKDNNRGDTQGDTMVAVVRKKKKIETGSPTLGATITDTSSDQQL